MKILILPQTKLGKQAVVLAVMWPILTILGSVVVNSVYPGVEAGDGIIGDFSVRPLLALTMLLGVVLGLISFPMSLVAILKRSERSVISFFTALLGLFLMVLLVGEIFTQH